MSMKIPAFTVILLLMMISGLSAQNYRVLQPDRPTLYQGQFEPILGMRVDSVTVSGSDTTYHLLKNLQQMDVLCFFIDGPSWLGEKITIDESGETVFFNAFNQPVLIKTLAVLNEEWTCFNTPALSIHATVSSIGISDILGQPDSIKTITFQAKDAGGENISHEVNNLSIVLSKNTGIAKTLNFYSFPDLYLGFASQMLQEFTLVGADNPNAGLQNLTWMQVHNHSPGDELHTVQINGWAYYQQRIEKIARLLNKSVFGGMVVYEWENKVKISTQDGGINTFTASIDTITESISPDASFDVLPGVAWNFTEWDAWNILKMGTGIHGLKKIQGRETNCMIKGFQTMGSDTCFNPIIICGCTPDHDYYEGLGGPYYTCGSGVDAYRRELVYYKKNGNEWGIPLDFTVNTGTIVRKESDELISIYPNPAEDFLNISLTQGNTINTLTIYNRYGQENGRHQITGNDFRLSLKNLSPGIYLLRFSGSGPTITRHLIKK
jgi:hypothetical protein